MTMNRYFIVGLMGVILLSGCARPPVISTIPSSERQIAPSGIFDHGSRTQPVVALTFDADMTPKMKRELETGVVKSWYDHRVTDILEKNQVPATLFITGMWAEIYPDDVKRLAANPLFEIGNHSYDHGAFHLPCYGLGAVRDKREEVVKTQDILMSLTGVVPRYFRFPGGCSSSDDVKLVSDLGVQVVGWDDVSGDAYLRDRPEPIVLQTVQHAQNGSVIVMHMHGGPTAPQTGAALQDIIDGLRARGFTFVKTSDLEKSAQKSQN